MRPYFQQGAISVYLGDCREVLPALDLANVGAVVADPPYGETSLKWDRWPIGWPDAIASAVPESAPLWCFGSMRMFLDRATQFSQWRFAQDLVWEKHNGSSSQKPIGIVEPLLRYSVAPGRAVLDPFAGSGTTLVVAKSLGLAAIGIETDERWCEAIAGRLAQEMAFPSPEAA